MPKMLFFPFPFCSIWLRPLFSDEIICDSPGRRFVTFLKKKFSFLFVNNLVNNCLIFDFF